MGDDDDDDYDDDGGVDDGQAEIMTPHCSDENDVVGGDDLI